MRKNHARVARGAFYTKTNPFTPVFINWLVSTGCSKALDCCAGDGALPKLLDRDLQWTLFDIEPKAPHIGRRDCMADFPVGFDLCITNPPYLSKRRAKAMRIESLECDKNLWQAFVNLALKHCNYVAAIVPIEILRRPGIFPRLQHILLLPPNSCDHTEQPVCLALFDVAPQPEVKLWEGSLFLGTANQINQHPFLREVRLPGIQFNIPNGIIGLCAADSRSGCDIKFIPGEKISQQRVRLSSRHLTRISLPIGPLDARQMSILIGACNEILANLRRDTHDLLLTPIHGARLDGRQRRRLTYSLAARIISVALRRIGFTAQDSASPAGTVPKE